MEEIQEKILKLREELHQHNHKYYIEDAPIISDFAFDQMLRELQELENTIPSISRSQFSHAARWRRSNEVF